MTRETNKKFVRFGLIGVAAVLLLSLIAYPVFTLLGVTESAAQALVGPFWAFGTLVSLVSLFLLGLFPRFLGVFFGPTVMNWAEGVQRFRRLGLWVEDAAVAEKSSKVGM